eukprot:TRINITY_DN17693_c0_g1_i1.p1 TRINITY_DN17693_c0_g1~~TRINITY_DN17693_c0_g1_i1.p1  ORF type:complete len:200 (-),score=24.87 TRINITY_DN17693_c0_g1_i1:65-664(-)
MFPSTKLGLHVGSLYSSFEVELFLDFTCPFSKKSWVRLETDLLPKYGEKIHFIVHKVVQPWHHQSICVHELASVVQALYPSLAFKCFSVLFENQDAFNNRAVHGLTLEQIYKKLVNMVTTHLGTDPSALISYLLPSSPGEINGVSQKRWTKNEIKYHRTRSVHVTPTVFVNGMEATNVSSGWTLQQWSEFLDPLLPQKN